MSKGPQFSRWSPLVEQLLKVLGVPLGTTFYDSEKELWRLVRLSEKSRKWFNEVSLAEFVDEHNWHVQGRPYFKVWPGIAYAMTNVKLDIASSCFESPYLSWELRLPRSDRRFNNINHTCFVSFMGRESCISGGVPPGLTGMPDYNNRMIDEMEKTGGRLRYISRVYYHHVKETETTADSYAIYDNESLEDGFLRTQIKSPRSKGHKIGDEARADLFRILIATSMFAISKHELVMPEVKQQVIEKRPRGKKKQKALAKSDRTPIDPKGWLVGSEVDLPRPIVISGSDAHEDSGRELQYGHVRSGHMKMQPCGPQHQDRKLIFVAPTIVRPDLPIRQQHGYRIRDVVL